MTLLQAKLALVEDASDETIGLLSDMDGPRIAMSYAVHAALLSRFPDLCSPLDFQDEQEQQFQMARVLEVWQRYSEFLASLALSRAETALLTLRAIQTITLHTRVSRAAAHFGHPAVWVRNGELKDYVALDAVPAEVMASPDAPVHRSARPLLRGPVSVLPEGCRIDLRTGQINKDTVDPDAPLRLSLRYADKRRSRLRQCWANLQRIRRYRASGARTFLLDLPAPALTQGEAAVIAAFPDPAWEGDTELAGALGVLARVTVADIRSRVPDLARLLRTHRRRIDCIDLNHVATGYNAAILQAARIAEVPTRLFNHGNVVAHGGPVRHQLADLIARNSHNDHPEAGRIAPMSPYHVPEGCDPARVDRLCRLRPGTPATRGDPNRPFRMLLAPNFLTWRGAFPGLVTTCYETMALIDFIAHKVAGDPRFELAIRIKTTVADEATLKTRLLKRGLVPENVEHLFALADNIVDSNLGSYRQALDEADLVITEGMTKVIYEALEHRTPVVLLNLSPDRVPAAPGVDLSRMQSDPRRHPIYHGACDDALMSLLEKVRDRHLAGPLLDAELAAAIWTAHT